MTRMRGKPLPFETGNKCYNTAIVPGRAGCRSNRILQMKETDQRQGCAVIIALFLSVVLAACRTGPIQSRPEPEPASEKPLPQEPAPQQPAVPPQAPPALPHPPAPAKEARWPESRIAPPEKDFAALHVDYNTTIRERPGAAANASWRFRTNKNGQIVGFEFSNPGGNRILLPRREPVKNQFFTRDFQFRFDDRARQDIHLLISDWVASRDRLFRLSELMNTVMLFFPRAVLPAIVDAQSRNVVTLPTGEEVEFDALTHEIVAGALREAPVDLNPDRAARKFPEVGYHGKGITVRADARGNDPRIGTTAVISTGSPPAGCEHGAACSRCEIPAKDLWEQSGAARFKFANDRDFERFLTSRCGFHVPEVGMKNGGGQAGQS